MANWQEVKHYLYNEAFAFCDCEVVQDDGNAVQLALQWAPGRSQSMTISVIPVGLSQVICINSPIGQASQIDANRLLQLTDESDSGPKLAGVKQVSGVVMTHSIVALPLGISQLDWAVKASAEADEYAQAFRGQS